MRLIILCLILCTSGFNPALAEKRIALVIGNSAYETTGWDLENPVNDAELISGALETVGFEVHTVLDGSKTDIEEAFQAHADRLKEAGEEAVGFFFYAGHGAQHRGVNYLISSDAQLRSGLDLMRQPKLDLVMDYLEYAGNQTNFIVLDACRNNPPARFNAQRSAGPRQQPTDTRHLDCLFHRAGHGRRGRDGPDQ